MRSDNKPMRRAGREEGKTSRLISYSGEPWICQTTDPVH
jgi:hypothetical protein